MLAQIQGFNHPPRPNRLDNTYIQERYPNMSNNNINIIIVTLMTWNVVCFHSHSFFCIVFVLFFFSFLFIL